MQHAQVRPGHRELPDLVRDPPLVPEDDLDVRAPLPGLLRREEVEPGLHVFR